MRLLLTALYRQTVVYQSSPFNCGRKRLQNTPSVPFANVHVIDIGGIYFSIVCGGFSFGMGDIMEHLDNWGT